MSINVAVLAVGIAAILAGRPAAAHHAFAAEYDAGKPVKVTGTVTKLEWMNPHVWIYVDVPEADGKVANWGCEMGSPNGLMRLGWTRFSLRPGDVVTIEGSRAKSGLNTASCTAVTNAKTGQQLFSGSDQTPQP